MTDAGKRLKQFRLEKEKTAAEFAELMGVSLSAYIRYENGDGRITTVRFVTLAKYYNVSLDYLAGLIDEPRKLYFNDEKNKLLF